MRKEDGTTEITLLLKARNLNALFTNLLRFLLVQAERLELSHLAALDPKSSVSTNSTTPA
ncbi:hypothetical protein PI23P_01410 [Polaribacter irgensii 23-P]|uniref:Uncharacterized protein n=1 Tax=Polaribacter irgensii 23-P TaxID=313594 RepID=A4C2L9_9FLAO|nr:hypothetical protein PI23P_01410 [Polaribacter irgensii 23-P]